MRETGWYWVKLDDYYEIGYWNKLFWVLTDSENHFEDDYFQEIDEKQIKRDSLIKFEIDILSKHIEHPTKPGYKRKDIVDRIKELQKQLDE